jgi:hypothetical protein
VEVTTVFCAFQLPVKLSVVLTSELEGLEQLDNTSKAMKNPAIPFFEIIIRSYKNLNLKRRHL